MPKNLSENFTLAECIKSQTAERLGIDNTPDEATIDRMAAVADAILEPVRAKFGGPVIVSSFYRCKPLNRAIGSKDSSQHVLGEAVDFEVPGIPNPEVAEWVRDNLTYDQLILEFHKPGIPDSGWVHVSYSANRCRLQCLTVNGEGTFQGLQV